MKTVVTNYLDEWGKFKVDNEMTLGTAVKSNTLLVVREIEQQGKKVRVTLSSVENSSIYLSVEFVDSNLEVPINANQREH